jgi:hypothetical protein
MFAKMLVAVLCLLAVFVSADGKPVLIVMHRLENTDEGLLLMFELRAMHHTTSVVASQCGTSACPFLAYLFRSLTLFAHRSFNACVWLSVCSSSVTACDIDTDCHNVPGATAMCGARANCFCNRPYAYVTARVDAESGCYRKFSFLVQLLSVQQVAVHLHTDMLHFICDIGARQ